MANNAETRAQQIEETVPTPENGATAAQQARTVAADGLGSTAAGNGGTAAAQPTARDNFRNRFGGQFAEGEDMDDEDTYYGKANQYMDEYEGMQNNLNNVRNAVGNSEDFQEMLAELSEWNEEHPDQPYSIMHFIAKKVRQGELDLDELQNNPDYADQIAEAQAQRTKDADEKKALEEEGAKNFDESIAMMKRVADERGLTPEQVNSAMEKLYGIFDNLGVNKITEEDFNAILDAQNYGDDVAQAREEGKAEGVNTKVTDRLRHMPSSGERGGRQTARTSEVKPEQSQQNMFGI